MTSKLLAAAIGALLVLPPHAQAQHSRPGAGPADPTDPTVAVPPTVYRSVIAAPAPAPQGEQATPDKSWRAANDAVAGTSGHAGHGGHAGHAAHGAPGGEQKHDAPVAAPAASAASAPATPANPAPVDHSKHH